MAENQAGSDLPASLRLTQVAKDYAKNSSCGHDDNQLDDNDQENVFHLSVYR